MEQGGIHRDNPFATPEGDRSPARRLRGRMPAPVTIWTAGTGESSAALTVSSLLVAEGEPSLILGLINELTSLYEAIESTGRFNVHLLGSEDRVAAEVFAGLRPSPGGPFAAYPSEDGPYGPELEDFPTMVSCDLRNTQDAGYHRLITGTIDEYRLDPAGTDPLVHHRGSLKGLG